MQGIKSPNLSTDEAGGGTRACCLHCRYMGGERDVNHIHYLFSSFWKAVPGLTQPLFNHQFFPLSGRGFQCNWTGLITSSGGLFPDTASWTGRIMRVYLGLKFVSWAQVSRSVHPGCFHKAWRTLQVCAKQHALVRLSCSPSGLQTVPNQHAGLEEGEELIFLNKDARTVQREINHHLPTLWFPLTTYSKFKRQL